MQPIARTRPLVRGAAVALALLAPAALSACSVKERSADQVAGKQAFVKKCGSCHVLNRAGTKGVTGPNLDEAFHQGLADGLGDDGVRGVVRKQIAYPSRSGVKGAGVMPANLASGEQADDIADYVAAVVSRPGKDGGLLASAVKTAGSDKPIAEEGGKLSIPADPGGGLLYASTKATGTAGAIEVDMPNESGVPHNIVIDGKGATKVVPEGHGVLRGGLHPGHLHVLLRRPRPPPGRHAGHADRQVARASGAPRAPRRSAGLPDARATVAVASGTPTQVQLLHLPQVRAVPTGARSATCVDPLAGARSTRAHGAARRGPGVASCPGPGSDGRPPAPTFGRGTRGHVARPRRVPQGEPPARAARAPPARAG